MNKRSVSMLLILAMLVTLLSGLSLTAAAQESIGAPVWEDGEAEETSEDIDIYFVDEMDTDGLYVYCYDGAVGDGMMETAEDLGYPGGPMTEAEGTEMRGHNYYKITLNTESANTVIFGNGNGTFSLEATDAHTAPLSFVDDAMRPAPDEESEENAFVVYAVKLENGVFVATKEDDVWPAPIQIIEEPGCTTEGKQAYVGLRTGALAGEETIAKLGHDWDDGTVLQEATYLDDGSIMYSCRRCHETKTETIPKKENPFVDVLAGDYFFKPVMWAISQKPPVTKGTDDTHFSPHADCTREQIVTFLWAANGKPEPQTTESNFSDVTPNDWFFKAVMWASENKIASGMGGGIFGVGQSCTRAQAMTFLWASEGKPAPNSTESPFDDVTPNDWFFKSILWAAENGITKGVGDGLFGVNNTCTRAQIMTFLYKTSLLED